MFKFSIYAEIGLRGFWLTLFAEDEDEAMAKAKKTVHGERYRINNVEEIVTT